MIVVQISHGFGNQIFQYMYAIELSKKYPHETIALENNHYDNQKHSFDIREYQLSFFDNLKFHLIETNFFKKFHKFKKNSNRRIWQIKNYFNFNSDNYFIIKDETSKLTMMISYFFKNKYYIGSWNKYKFSIANIREEFKKLKINEEINKSFINNAWKIKIKKTNSIAVCVRRSDYVKIGESSDLNYFNSAIEFFNKKFKNNIFFIFSDDISWCKDNFNNIKNVNFIHTNNIIPLEDLLLISYCKHAIISKSSFNLFGCYINENIDKIIITEREWDIDFKIDFRTLLLNDNFRVMCEHNSKEHNISSS